MRGCGQFKISAKSATNNRTFMYSSINRIPVKFVAAISRFMSKL